MEFKEFLIKHGILEKFCKNIYIQWGKVSCVWKHNTARINSFTWNKTEEGSAFWCNYNELECEEVKEHKHTYDFYYNLYIHNKTPKCLKRF